MSPDRALALELSQGLDPSPSNILRVAGQTSADAARWGFAQWELRRRAKSKFSRSLDMLFVREALEQATHERVAEYHASLFPAGKWVVDATCGIGGDLIALARRGEALGFELDSDRAECARHNLKCHQLTADVSEADSLAWLEVNRPDYWMADPARRIEGRRTLNVSDFAPDPLRLAEIGKQAKLSIMKLTPMLSDALLGSIGTRVEFISFGGECREALAINGSEAVQGVFAVHIESREVLPSSPPPPTSVEPGSYFFDADPASVRAHGLGELAVRHGLSALGDAPGYLTGDQPILSPWLRSYRVLWHGKADPKRTKQALRDLGAATPEVKQRGAGVDGIQERKRFTLDGKLEVSLAIWAVGKSLRHTILERIVPPNP